MDDSQTHQNSYPIGRLRSGTSYDIAGNSPSTLLGTPPPPLLTLQLKTSARVITSASVACSGGVLGVVVM
ncbi:hypothetical protein GBAR_LOCUS11676 [Geodia barretti]|uniref:Uncharacterized protein n=1 Tax=Geodia barretti TaxID=519541 RepID=A0AA35WJH6_GEOBA|nr:hypothetical protein GBAR_LOCUS11676 [Geodia barretti]